jgi:RimJ/RimL family protein N-acetyltransferase
MATVRSLDATQWRELRAVRLRALRDAPEAFLTTSAEAEAQPDEYWSNRAAMAARGDGWGIFLAYARGGDVVGMVAGVDDPERPRVVELIQMWVDPSARGRSVGVLLVEAVVRWASWRADRMRLGVATDNHAAMALYARNGFTPTGEEQPFKGRPGINVRYYERPLR